MTFIRSYLTKNQRTVVPFFAAIVAFCTYSCMYAFRKPFAAATFQGAEAFGIQLKIVLVIAQLIGYTLSKFVGIRFISEIKHHHRARGIFILLCLAALALLFFALLPTPYNVFFMFLNGIPLGLIWGLVFSYLEGRRATEFMGSVLAISFIFSSGFVKSVGKWLMENGTTEAWMPFQTGMLFLLPAALFIFLLEQIPPPSKYDQEHRSERAPMTKKERKDFLDHYFFGIVVLVISYVLLSVLRDFRDSFAADIWKELGVNSAAIFTTTEVPISLAVLLCMSLLTFIHHNRKAVLINHVLVIFGFLITGFSTLAYANALIEPTWWMILNGLGLYLAYIPFNVVFFERLIAAARKPANVGFLMYISDSFGYLGSIFVMLYKNFGQSAMSYRSFFINALGAASVLGTGLMVISFFYFNQKLKVKV